MKAHSDSMEPRIVLSTIIQMLYRGEPNGLKYFM